MGGGNEERIEEMSETIDKTFNEISDKSGIKEIITIKQLPVMEERFREINGEIQYRLSRIGSLEISEETKAEVKKILADLRKEFETFEGRRKQVKSEINKPYDEMNELYKEYIENPYKEAFNTLSAKVSEIESRQKNTMLDEIRKYYVEYKESLGLTFPNFDANKFTINLTTTIKNLKEQIRKHLDGVKRDIESINTMGEHADRIMVAYRNVLDLSSAIKIVNDRIKEEAAYEAEKAKAAEIAAKQAEIVEKVDEAIKQTEPEITPPEEIPKPEYENKETTKPFPFIAWVTREKFDKLIKFMKDEGIKYGKYSSDSSKHT